MSGVTCAAAAAAAAAGGAVRATSAGTKSVPGYPHAAANFFLVEDVERGETPVSAISSSPSVIASFGAKAVVRATSAVGTADAVALPNNEKVNPAAPRADTAALVLRFCFEACFTCGMISSCVSRRKSTAAQRVRRFNRGPGEKKRMGHVKGCRQRMQSSTLTARPRRNKKQERGGRLPACPVGPHGRPLAPARHGRPNTFP